jgi:hypothetical protein
MISSGFKMRSGRVAPHYSRMGEEAEKRFFYILESIQESEELLETNLGSDDFTEGSKVPRPTRNRKGKRLLLLHSRM